MTAITEKATLGQPITFTEELLRQRVGVKRFWKARKREERTGVIVGVRTLWDGDAYTEDLDEEDGGGYHTSFVPRDHRPALLVAYALNRKPILVPLDNAVAA